MNRENAIGITESATSYRGAVVLVPTRNRARIAMNAIRSVLDHPVGDIEVLVSDNSTSEEDREELASFCSTLADSRLRYLRPPASLAMPAHWDWAIEQALSFSSVSHFCYLTDRMMFKTGALQEVLNIAALYPERVISYNHDRIVDDAKPIRIEQYAGTEKLLEIQTLRLSYLFSQAIFHHALPRMLNCIVPRRVLERMRSRFGNVFSSIAPDFNFCCRCLELENSILFYDKSPIFHYALNRSNGASTTRGEITSDSADFIANLPVDNSFRNYATPIPQLITAVNAAFNEYLIFRQQTKSSRFFEVDRQKYLEANAAEIREVSDPALRADMTALLVEHGYNDLRQQAPVNPLASTAGRSRSSSDSIWQKVKLTLAEAASAPERKRASIFGTTPPTELQLEFAEIEEAIDYAKNISQGNRSNSLVHTELLQARQLPLPERFPKG